MSGLAPESSALAQEQVPQIARAGLLLGPLLFLVVLSWPDLGLDSAQRRVAAVAAWTATWWITSALPVGATSLLPAALLPLLGALEARAVAPLYMHDLVLLFLGAFLLTRGLERWNVHRRFALWVLSRVGARPRRLVFGLMSATALVSLWVNNTATALLMLPIALAVIASFPRAEPRAHAAFARAILLGVAYSASVGGMGTPVGTAPNQVFLGLFRARYPDGPEISFAQWTLTWLPLVLVYLPLGSLLLTRVLFRVPADLGQGGGMIEQERAALGRMSRAEKRMATVFCLAALLWVTRADLDLGFALWRGWGSRLAAVSGMNAASDATVALALALVAFLFPSGESRGGTLLDWKTAQTLPWDVLLLIGGGFALAGAFEATHLDQVLGSKLAPLFAGRSEWGIVLALVLFVIAISEIASNTATTQVLLPVMGQAAANAGLSPLLTMLPTTLAASAGFMLPVATPPNAIAFATGWIPATTMARAGIVFDLLLALLITLVFQLWGRFVLGIEAGVPPWARG